MSAATKVSIAVIVLFAAVLGIYYGFGGPPVEAQATETPGESAAPAEQPIDLDDEVAGESPLADSIEEQLFDAGGAFEDDAEPVLAHDEAAPPHRPWTIRAPLVTDPGPEPVPDPTATRYVDYVVQDGDSMWTIAAERLGSGTRWQEIADANPDVDPERLDVGDRLRIPTGGTAGAVGLNRPVAIKPTADADRSASKVRYHTVRSGDSLSAIAERYYRDQSRWRAIWQANRAVLGSDPHRLKVGMRLRVP